MSKSKTSTAPAAAKAPKVRKPTERMRALFADAKNRMLAVLAKPRKDGSWIVYVRLVAAGKDGKKDAQIGMVAVVADKPAAEKKFSELKALAAGSKWAAISAPIASSVPKSAFTTMPAAA